MSDIDNFIEKLESNIIDKNYQLSTYNNEIITYYWPKKSIILDILIYENIIAINDNNDVSFYSMNNFIFNF